MQKQDPFSLMIEAIMLVNIEDLLQEKTGMYLNSCKEEDVENMRGKLDDKKMEAVMKFFSKNDDYKQGHINGLLDALALVTTMLAQRTERAMKDMPQHLKDSMPKELIEASERMINNPLVIKEMMDVTDNEVTEMEEASLDEMNRSMWDMLDTLGQEEGHA